jgi:hypothetical protein
MEVLYVASWYSMLRRLTQAAVAKAGLAAVADLLR